MSHRAAVVPAPDASAWAGDEMFTVNGDGRDLPAAAAWYPDPVALVTGYGTHPTYALSTIVANVAVVYFATEGAGGTFTIGIDGAGYVYLEASATDFELYTGPLAAQLGFTADTGLAGGVAPFRHTAPARWSRGIIDATGGFIIEADGAAFAQVVANQNRLHQSLPVWLRARGSVGDADDAWAGYSLADIDDADATWHINGSGHVVRMCGSADPLVITHDGLARYLGSRPPLEGSAVDDGHARDTREVSGGVETYTMAAPVAGWLSCRSLLLRRLDHLEADTARAVSGQVTAFEQYTARGWEAQMLLAGPALGAVADQADRLREFNRLSVNGVTVFPAWGDRADDAGAMETRRHRAAWRAGSDPTESLLYTADAGHPRVYYGARAGGRLILRRDVGDDVARRAEGYDGPVDAYQEVTIRLWDDLEEHPEAADERDR